MVNAECGWGGVCDRCMCCKVGCVCNVCTCGGWGYVCKYLKPRTRVNNQGNEDTPPNEDVFIFLLCPGDCI